MGKLKYTYEDVSKSFNEREYTLLTTKDEYKNSSQKLQYICNKHKEKGVLEITYSKLITGRGCMHCGHERTALAKSKPFNYYEAIDLCLRHNFKFVDLKRENSVLYIYFICNKHKEFGIQKMRKTNMKRNIKGCKYCKGDFPEWYVRQKITDLYPHIEIIGKYINMSTGVNCYCKKHDVYWITTPQKILNGHECVECGKEKLSKYHTLSQKEFEDMVALSNPNIDVISNYKGLEYDLTVKCKKCGNVWVLNANSLKTNGTRCKECSYTYKGEDKIIKILQEIKCNFIHQYKFNDCKDKRCLPFDFYLPDYNLCIEFDGEQHYNPKFGKENFKKTREHDKIKNNYCKSNNIKLLRIPYWEGNNMEKIIKDSLKTNRIN